MSLIRKLEEAEGPSRELDTAIANAIGWTYMRSWALSEAYWLNPSDERAELPPFTASIDAALTLVQEGCGWELDSWPQGKFRYHAHVGGGYHGLHNTTPAIALCIAALKARGIE